MNMSNIDVKGQTYDFSRFESSELENLVYLGSLALLRSTTFVDEPQQPERILYSMHKELRVLAAAELMVPTYNRGYSICTLRRLGVADTARRLGLGSELFNIVLADAKLLGFDKLNLFSSTSAVPFYAKQVRRGMLKKRFKHPDDREYYSIFNG